MTTKGKWIAGALVAATVLALAAIAGWRALAPKPGGPNEDAMVDALEKLGCDDAFATHRSMDGTDKGPNEPVFVSCAVHQGGPLPTCDAIHAAWRSTTKSTLPAEVVVRGPHVLGCSQRFGANGAPMTSSS